MKAIEDPEGIVERIESAGIDEDVIVDTEVERAGIDIDVALAMRDIVA